MRGLDIPIGSDKKSPMYFGTFHFAMEEKVKPMMRRIMWIYTELRASRFPIIREVTILYRLVQLLILGIKVCRIINNELPDPTVDNVIRHNSVILCRIRDRFFLMDRATNNYHFKAIWKVGILIYDGDLFYTERIDEMARELIQSDWDFLATSPRPKWWGDTPLCPTCGNRQGTMRVFADCPEGMHIEKEA